MTEGMLLGGVFETKVFEVEGCSEKVMATFLLLKDIDLCDLR
jgi:hypothetical protein